MRLSTTPFGGLSSSDLHEIGIQAAKAIVEVNEAVGKAIIANETDSDKILLALAIGISGEQAVTEFNRLTGVAIPLLQNSDIIANQNAIAASLRQLVAYVAYWETTQLLWAIRGQRDDGTSFDFSKWFRLGYEYMKSAEQYGQFTSDYTRINQAWIAIKEFFDGLDDPTGWPSWLKWTLGIAIAVAVLPTVSNVLTISNESRRAVRGD